MPDSKPTELEAFPQENPLEARKSRFRRELVWSSAVFALVFLTVIGSGSAIIIKDLSNKEVFRVLSGYSRELEESLAKVPTTQTLKGYQQQKIITTRLDAFLTEKKIFDSVELYDDKGKLVYHDDRLEGATLYGGAPASGLQPGQQHVETRNRIPIAVPVALEPGKVGKAILSVSQDVLQRQATQFRLEMITKLVGMIALVLLMVGLAYLYVLRILRLSRRLEEEAQEQKRLSYLGLLSSGIAHEIKNPLNSIQMNLQLLEEEALAASAPGQLAGFVEPIQKEIRRLERLVNDFLAFARPITPDLQSVDVRTFLDSVAQLVAEEARRQGIRVIVDAEEDLPDVVTDENLLRMAFLNLVFNAIQSPQEGGEVRLEARREGDRLFLEVVDQGPGVPAEKREQVFQIFYTTKPGGTGLGLPIARRIVEALGGTLSLVGSQEKGARFQMDLPLGTR